MSEAAIVRHLLKRLRALPRCYAIKTHGSQYQAVGTPDVIACYKGRMVVVEVKDGSKKLTAPQLRRLNEWIAAGARAAIVRSREKADRLIETLVESMREV